MKLLQASRETARLAIPIVSSSLINSVNLFIAMVLIARLGHAELAAGALVTSISTMLLVVAWSLLFSVAVVIGQAFGSGLKEEIGEILRSSWLLGTLIGVPVMLIMWYIAPILSFFHQPENLIYLTKIYFHGLMWVVLPSIWFVCNLEFVIAVNKPKVVIFWSLMRLILMLIPGYGLLFGKSGFPNIGMVGMAYANVFAVGITFLISVFYIKQKTFEDYKIFKFKKIINSYYLKKLFSVGWPISAQFGVELTAFSLTTIFVGWLGESALAAAQIAIQLNMIIIMVPYGIAQAGAILIGQALGRNQFEITRVLGKAAVLLGTGFILLISILYLFAPKILICFYLDIHNPANIITMNLAILLLAVHAFSNIFDSVRNIITGSLRGFHDTQVPMWVSVLSVWIIDIPASYIFGFVLSGGVVGVAMGFLVGVFVGSIILIKRFYQKTNVATPFVLSGNGG